MKHYDYILVGGGLFNGVVAREAGKTGEIVSGCGKKRRPGRKYHVQRCGRNPGP